MGSLPLRFWITTGIGIHPEHQINAYDQALYMAGISEQNIIAVSSVPPEIQLIPKIINGLTYVPVLDSMEDEKIHMFDTVEIDGQKHFILKNSWCINVVLARSDADQFQRATSSVGLGWYKTPKGYGIYAVEDHGNKTAEGSIDNCIEMLDRMMQYRGVKPIDDEPSILGRTGSHKSSEPIILQEDTKKYLAEKITYTSHSPKQRIYTISMDAVPEGYVATAIALVVMDPFTEIHS
jgi:pyruvoyl-dependent arginine decarboxylase (PvlArgDC)